jgi:DNA polymerase III subunit chi
LLEKCLERKWQVVIQTGSELMRDRLDQQLWSYSDVSFLAHSTDADVNAHQTPIVLTTDQTNPNNANVRFLVDNAAPSSTQELTQYERVIVMFDGLNESELSNARSFWKELKSKDYSLTYWQQTEQGNWKK